MVQTIFLLMARYEGLAVIPVATVCKDDFSHLKVEEFVRKVGAGELVIPLLRIERDNRRAAKGVQITDLAKWIDARAEEAWRESKAMVEARQPIGGRK
ncbi:pyocin activator PrtN family protein [Methylobacterium symbioticum]|uniref:Pyocin activator protein PrtN n=1 Tax=Methylobacterium symbioticum TaxID=2584084 RepID=A0A509EJ31_9HYPH|nr:pyocin activator PrtN family protein [Methylobacterium symbioticum]VUD73213.1 hypothetical protein MET9862_03828 [Methylobacterium symbioticum]